jgi:DNA replication regulator DPB11
MPNMHTADCSIAEQRKWIQETVSHNGAEYHGDLTKSVTHLIAATPSGKKYEHALNWRIKLVTWEWLQQSLERGLALDESCFHPTIPVDQRGKGAWERHQATSSPALGKRARDAGQADLTSALRRKLRRSASSRMGSQSEALWAGITAGGYERQKLDQDDWTEPDIAQQLVEPTVANPQATVMTHADAPLREDPASNTRGPFQDEHDGIFAGRVIFVNGFDHAKVRFSASLPWNPS